MILTLNVNHSAYNIFNSSQMVKQIEILKHHTNTLSVCIYAAGDKCLKARNAAQEAGFSGARWSDKSDNLSVMKCHGYIINQHPRPGMVTQILNLYH